MNERARLMNGAELRKSAKYVLYWAQMNRRVEWNHALAFAVELANEHGLPVLFYEALTCSYPHANDRMHTFLLEGVPETAKRAAKMGLGYIFYLRRRKSDANDVLYRLAADAAAVVTDDYPTFVARDHNASVPAKLRVPYYMVDASCIIPMSHFDKQEYAAYTIRPKIQRMLAQYLKPLEAVRVNHRYHGDLPFHTEVTDANLTELRASCDIDHSVAPSTTFRGGRKEAEKRLRHFLKHNLRRYASLKNEPSSHATSDLSPYLHFGHISSLEIALAARDYAVEHKLIAEEFLEELIVRRELAFNFARFSKSIDSLDALPDWARATLRKHAKDKRDPVYNRDQFERAATHDSAWNAMQRELLRTGKIHGYYRMYWGKKIIEWSPTHEDALATMIYLHDKYALDGRDPNTYTNILWCFGLHDRPWFERPIFGYIRYMALSGIERKTDVAAYLRENE
jgi:deoxyribodipyrimidine photo-lyase